MKIFFSCGETSGDRYAAELINTMLQTNPAIQCYGNGGEHLRSSGAKLLFNVVDKSTIGFIEPIAKIPFFLKVLKKTKACIEKEKIKMVVIIDHQGFNIPLARWCKSKGIAVYSFIAPQFWMLGNLKSAKTFVESCEHIFCVLKKEYDFYHKLAPKKVTYIGHPLVGMLPKRNPSKTTLVGLFPGSRPQEIKYCLPVMLKIMDNIHETYPNIQFKLALASEKMKPIIERFLGSRSVDITKNSKDLIATATISLVASGTVSLEHAIIGTPCIVMYQFSKISYTIAAAMVLIKLQEHCDGFMAMPNILAEKEVCPEFLQSKATPENILPILKELLEDDNLVNEITSDYKQIRNTLTQGQSPFEKVAQALL